MLEHLRTIRCCQRAVNASLQEVATGVCATQTKTSESACDDSSKYVTVLRYRDVPPS